LFGGILPYYGFYACIDLVTYGLTISGKETGREGKGVRTGLPGNIAQVRRIFLSLSVRAKEIPPSLNKIEEENSHFDGSLLRTI